LERAIDSGAENQCMTDEVLAQRLEEPVG